MQLGRFDDAPVGHLEVFPEAAFAKRLGILTMPNPRRATQLLGLNRFVQPNPLTVPIRGSQ